MKTFLMGLMAFVPLFVQAESANDEPFYALHDSKAFVEKDSMYRVDQAVVFKYRIDVDSSVHPWESLTRTVRTQCDSNNFSTISVRIVYKDAEKAPLELKGDEQYVQYEPKSYRDQMTKYVCEHAPTN